MQHIARYFLQYSKRPSPQDRLVMTILCRNEVDIIEANIRVHASLGVDAFVVMDNGSTDGTREKLEALTNEFELHIIDEFGAYQQAKWMRQLAVYAREKLSANWVISNDADEFWLPEKGSIKGYLQHKDSVITVSRSNMLLTEEALKDGYDFTQATHRVQYPICYDREVQKNDPNISMLLVPLSPKVIVNPNGFIKISGGNHRAKHWGKWLTAKTENRIRVYHYPIRSYQQFEANIKHRQALLKDPSIRMGDHYRRWVKLLEQGQLRAEFERLILSKESIKTLEKLQVVKADSRPQTVFSKLGLEELL